MSWLAVAAKDVRVELRARETLLPVLLTGLLVVTLGLLAFHDLHEPALVGAALVWIALAFAAAVGLARSFGAEKDRGTLDTLLALPLERGSLYLAKTAAAFATLLATALVVVPFCLLAEGIARPLPWPALLAVVLLGALGLAATGTLLSALVVQTRARDVLLPVLLLPLLVPLLLSSVHATQDVLLREPFDHWRAELMVLAGYDLAFLAASWLLFETAVGP